jgi:NAD(P)-dependent dehydrogenase (short-subunit alcohol dehydrogenase family)
MAASLANKVAIVTGGAKGIGLSIARQLGRAGSRVLIADVDSKAAEHSASALSSEGLRTSWVAVDVSRKEQVDTMVQQAVQDLGGVDIMVANAGAACQCSCWGCVQSVSHASTVPMDSPQCVSLPHATTEPHEQQPCMKRVFVSKPLVDQFTLDAVIAVCFVVQALYGQPLSWR